jgi:hypothetical protein
VIVPGLTVCHSCRIADASVTVDPGERFARPLCFDCLEHELERDSLEPGFRALLDAARESGRYFRPAPRTVDLDTADYSKLNGLRRQWDRYQLTLEQTSSPRCWAILPAGDRCSRPASVDEFLCDTHRAGCTVPGLGWADGRPCGQTVTARR